MWNGITHILAFPDQEITFWIILTGWIAILDILGRAYSCEIIVLPENERHVYQWEAGVKPEIKRVKIFKKAFPLLIPDETHLEPCVSLWVLQDKKDKHILERVLQNITKGFQNTSRG